MDKLPVLHTSKIPVSTRPLEQFLAGQLSPSTRRAYQADLMQFFGTDQLDLEAIRRITFHDIIEYRNALATQNYQRTTINRKLASLKAFFKMMVAANLIDSNPADSALVRGYRLEENISGKAIAERALKQILAEIDQEANDLIRSRDMALIHLLTYGGLRRSEAARMAWDDMHQEGAFYVLTLPQTKAGVAQDIKVQAIVIHHLEKYRHSLLANAYPTDGAVFLSFSNNGSHGRPLTDQSINLTIKKYARRAGLTQKITAHMFRHTCCTLAIEGGAKPQQVQAHLRHKDLKTTMRYYENREKLTDNASDYIQVG
ncbi:MAG: tyrosine-type recombinase/integrase [Candidatus Latescibacteria bacterium]|nr:tyrosine-type recombinase/integrase [Candidatus Latescibacterota bacterium]